MLLTRRASLLAGLGVMAGVRGASLFADEQQAFPSGDAAIRGKVKGSDGESEIVITTTKRLAGAIHSLTWNGREFIDSADHGRQLQSASNLDCGTPIQGETFNPTEAGSRLDGAGPTSTSRLLQLIAKDNCLQTVSQMAFWLAPHEKSGPHSAKNSTLLSNHVLTKRVTIGMPSLPNVVQYEATFSLPIDEHHTQAVFEVVTGYMPPEFSVFWKFDPASQKLLPLDDGPGEQSQPVVMATEDGRHAMGVFSPDGPPGMIGPGYGRFRFVSQRVVKWNCVFRLRDATGIRPADYSFRTFIPIGDLEQVRLALAELHHHIAEQSP